MEISMKRLGRYLLLGALAALFAVGVYLRLEQTAPDAQGDETYVLLPAGPANLADTQITGTKNAHRLAGKVVLIDAGHGGHDPGTEQPYKACALTPPGADDKIHEKDITLSIAQKVKDDLERVGATVYMTRETDVFVDLMDRVAMEADISKTPKGQRDHAASRPADIFISIHVNSVDYDNSFDEIGVYSYFDPGQKLSERVAPVLQREMGTPTRIITHMDFRVIDHNPTVPTILVETGFVTNPSKCRQLVDDMYQSKMARAISDGVDNYFNFNGTGPVELVRVTDTTAQHPPKKHRFTGHGHRHHRR
jgi:N-acetylmuramoyl-L-alanine amidase